MKAVLCVEPSSDFAVLTYICLVVRHCGQLPTLMLALHGNSTVTVHNLALLNVVNCGGKTFTAVSVLLRLWLGEIFLHLVSLVLARQVQVQGA